MARKILQASDMPVKVVSEEDFVKHCFPELPDWAREGIAYSSSSFNGQQGSLMDLTATRDQTFAQIPEGYSAVETLLVVGGYDGDFTSSSGFVVCIGPKEQIEKIAEAERELQSAMKKRNALLPEVRMAKLRPRRKLARL